MVSKQIIKEIQNIICGLDDDIITTNKVIKDGIFNVLEKHCNVLYYPIYNENNCGFHTKRYVNGNREDFVYINTAKPLSDQVFTAAHELGHVWNIIEKFKEHLSEISTEQSEEIINRFAAELLMPEGVFIKSFDIHLNEVVSEQFEVTIEELIKIIVLLMNDFMVPYKAVEKRLLETGIIKREVFEFLESNESKFEPRISFYVCDQNTMIDKITEKKTIPGIRDLVETVQKDGLIDEFSLCKIKKDFGIDDICTDGSLETIVDVSSKR